MNTLTKEPPAETWLRARYGAYRGHFAWRELEEAFNAGVAQEREECAKLLDSFVETGQYFADEIRARSKA